MSRRKVCRGAKFISDNPDKIFVKCLNTDLVDYGQVRRTVEQTRGKEIVYEYDDGVLLHPGENIADNFNHKRYTNGFHFTDMEFLDIWCREHDGPFAYVTIPDDATVVEGNPNFSGDYKTNYFVLSEFVPRREFLARHGEKYPLLLHVLEDEAESEA